ncbi:MAG: NAD(P)H-dependent oxidoreductase subunit E [Gammaproteobacteria bacterium]|nr:MAG: NAD(P)H-dependent oxidoreductase subunit E [Gammaproteobacteria bacterium]
MAAKAPLEKKRRKTRSQPRGRAVDSRALAEVRRLLGDELRRRDLLIEYLHRIQDTHGCLSAAHLVALAEEMRLAHSEVFEVASFYHHFDVVRESESAPPALTVRVCDSITCEMFGAEDLLTALEKTLGSGVRVQRVPCVGRCDSAPVAVVGTNPVERAEPDRVSVLVQDGATEADLPDCIQLEEYCRNGGYEIYRSLQAGERDPKEIIAALEDSGLRGLGGAGFPAGRKWNIVSAMDGPRLMAVNIDEGEPGTFKDRHYLEQDPHRFLEGVLIAAHVVDISEIYLYLRDEYAGCRRLLERELAALDGDPRLPHPPIHLRRGAGAYICGEESAMIESIEGKRGMPRLRPPFVAEVGLFGRPTLEHNMETLHWVRAIVEQGPEWFTSHGRHGRKGLRSFSVSGRINKPGVHVAPAGITLRELIDEYCDGMPAGHELQAYFPGGASGGILPASMDNIPLDFDTLNDHGCFIGSAAIIILSQHDDVQRAARNAMRFFVHESCGQCTPCRVGTVKALELMQQPHWDRPLLEELSSAMMDASICGLGQAAPNPLLCTMKYFPGE